MVNENGYIIGYLGEVFNDYSILESLDSTNFNFRALDKNNNSFEINSNGRELLVNSLDLSTLTKVETIYSDINSLEIDLYPKTSYPNWFVNQLENTAKVNISDKKEEGVILTFQSNDYSFSLSANKYIDIDKEVTRLNKKIDELKKSLEISTKRLSNDKFIQNAKKDLIDQENQNTLLADFTKQDVEKVAQDTDRDFWMTAQEAKEYGIVDEVLIQRELAEK